MSDLLQFSFSGLTNGSIYALIALGFCVANNTMGIPVAGLNALVLEAYLGSMEATI